MPYYCTVPRCTSMAGKAKNVSFHQFPRDEELAKLWNRILKRGKPYTKYSKVCSLHFKPEDYTITSVGKNKGQWRTLRKDAIPSQNLPSESPVPYTRRSSGCWVPGQPSLTDPLVQQQMAQAIYMQTMLAMQAAGVSESLAPGEPPAPESTKPSPSSSSLSEIELLLRRDTEQPKEVTFKCHECTKCFKDPDVFLLHKRTHKNDTTHIEKENYSANIQDGEDTLRANPILANLLKTSMRLEPENSVNNILTVENQIMAALASNMEAYIRTLSSMISNQANAIETEDKGDDESDYEDEANDGDSNVGKEAKADEDMCVDDTDNDNTPMDDERDETHDGNELIQDENDEIRDNFEVTVSVNRVDTSAENMNSHGSIDDSTREVTSEARNDTEINDNHSILKDKSINMNDDSREKTQVASDDTLENIDSTNLNEVHNDATDHESNECESDNKIRNDAPGNVIDENNDTTFSLDENEINDGTDEVDDISTKDELNDGENDAAAIHKDTSDVTSDRDETLDEMTADGKLVKAGISCDSHVDTVDLMRVDIEFET